MSKTNKNITKLFQCMNWISIKCIINANSEVIRINYGRWYAFRRSCETAAMLQLSKSWYRIRIVYSTVCSVLACAWVSSFLVWNRYLPYRWFQCFHYPFDVLDSSRHADSKQNSCFSGALWFCDRAFFPFFWCILHRVLATWSYTRPVICPRCSWHYLWTEIALQLFSVLWMLY